MHQPQEGTVSQLATSSPGVAARHLISPRRCCGLLSTRGAQRGEFGPGGGEYLEQMEVAPKPLAQTVASERVEISPANESAAHV